MSAILSDVQVLALMTELDQLYRQKLTAEKRIKEIHAALAASGEAKVAMLREMGKDLEALT